MLQLQLSPDFGERDMAKNGNPRAAQMPRASERYVLVPEIMERCGIRSRMTVDDWVRRGKLPPKRRVGIRRVGWLESELSEFMRSIPTVA
jgi:predicted DNA-binding transcriptional regulator AlpA